MQIDDGYQTAIGDWLSVNAKFPSGMAALARRIRDTGYRPGLWLAPFTVSANSLLARDHPDWLVRGANGKPAFAGHNWAADLYALDTTHPAARDWLRDVFTTIVREWGYDYLKLDFLACGAVEGQRHDPRATRASALRDGLALIREIVGDDVYILGCGCPLLSAVGIVDAMRIGPDSAPYWAPRYEGMPVPFGEGHALPTMEGAVRNTLARAWMHPTLWTNDPDCLLVRERRSELTLDEVRAFATAVGLTGGMVVVSDRLPDLPAERLEIVVAAAATAPRPRPARRLLRLRHPRTRPRNARRRGGRGPSRRPLQRLDPRPRGLRDVARAWPAARRVPRQRVLVGRLSRRLAQRRQPPHRPAWSRAAGPAPHDHRADAALHQLPHLAGRT